MVLEEAGAGFLYSLKKHKRSLASQAALRRLVSWLPLLRGPQRASLEPAAVPIGGHLWPGCGIVQAHGHGNISSNRPLTAAARGAGGPRRRGPTWPVQFIYAR